MYQQMYGPNTKLFMIGPVCSSVAQPVNEAAILWNINSVGFNEGYIDYACLTMTDYKNTTTFKKNCIGKTFFHRNIDKRS